MTDPAQLLAQAQSILLIDYPGVEVPHAVARAGYATSAHEGPGPVQYCRYEPGDGGEIARSRPGPGPEHVDVVYTYRPVDELPEIVEYAVGLGAKTVWFQDDGATAGAVDRARQIVEGAGLEFATGAIADVVG